MKIIYFALLSWALIGCQGKLDFSAISSPPPSKQATLNDGQKTIRISPNVALAVECRWYADENNSYPTGPCSDLQLIAENSQSVQVYKAYVDELLPVYESGYYDQIGSAPASVFVVVGKTPGVSNIRIETQHGQAEFEVTVLND